MKRANAGTAEKKCPIAGVEIPITDIGPLMIGQTENKESGTGCTVLVCKDGMRAGLDLRGGGPASRDIQLLNPLTTARFLNAILLSGGSAYGLGATRLAFEAPNYQDGNFGAGCGASVGKIAGMEYAMKTGIGSYAVQIGDLKIRAIVVLNDAGGRRHECGFQQATVVHDRGNGPQRVCQVDRSIRAVYNAESAYGIPSASDLR